MVQFMSSDILLKFSTAQVELHSYDFILDLHLMLANIKHYFKEC